MESRGWSYEAKLGGGCKNNWFWGLRNRCMDLPDGEEGDISEGTGPSTNIMSPVLEMLHVRTL